MLTVEDDSWLKFRSIRVGDIFSLKKTRGIWVKTKKFTDPKSGNSCNCLEITKLAEGKWKIKSVEPGEEIKVFRFKLIMEY